MKPIKYPTDDICGWSKFDMSKGPIGAKIKSIDHSGPITSSDKKSDCKHDYDFKYVKERITEEGKIIRQDHYFCRRCLEEKVIESE